VPNYSIKTEKINDMKPTLPKIQPAPEKEFEQENYFEPEKVIAKTEPCQKGRAREEIKQHEWQVVDS
jgi:hypothetical protein